MKALKIIANAIKKELNVSTKDCTVYFQGTNYVDNKCMKLTAAIVGINASNEMYKIRIWHDKPNTAYCRRIEENETMRDAYIKLLCL